jgi:hypothetical protein
MTRSALAIDRATSSREPSTAHNQLVRCRRLPPASDTGQGGAADRFLADRF